MTPEQEAILTGHQKPIMLLDRRSNERIPAGGNDFAISEEKQLKLKNETKQANMNGARLAPSVAPGNPKVGVMLPYAPVQLLIFQYDDGIEMPELLPAHQSVAMMRKRLRNYPIYAMRFCHIIEKFGFVPTIQLWIFIKMNRI